MNGVDIKCQRIDGVRMCQVDRHMVVTAQMTAQEIRELAYELLDTMADPGAWIRSEFPKLFQEQTA